MEYRILGQTGLRVSRLCFGALTIGPLQANLPVAEGAAVLNRALSQGVNFIDTAQMYKTYPYIREAIRDKKHEIVVASKAYAYTAKDMELALKQALEAIDRDYLDIMLLHEQESILTVKGHWEAVEYLLKAKEQGLVRAIGLSTHMVAGVRAAIEVPEMEVIHPMLNFRGVGISDGTVEDMLAALQDAKAAGKGIYGMKPLGGGNLIEHYKPAMEFVLRRPELDAIAMGMKSTAEVDFNLQVFAGQEVPEQLRRLVSQIPRTLHIEKWCSGCGQCVERCHSQALSLQDGQAKVQLDKCLRCGYCGPVCPDFCIKII